MNWFRNRKAEELAKQLDWEQRRCQNDLAILEGRHQREMDRLEKAHAQTVLHVIEERDRLRDDIQRLQFVIQPSLQHVVTVQDREKQEERDQNAPPVFSIPTGSPWTRLQAEWAKQLEAEEKSETEKKLEARARMQAEAEAVAKGEHKNGGIS